jgi:hypothetical protein
MERHLVCDLHCCSLLCIPCFSTLLEGQGDKRDMMNSRIRDIEITNEEEDCLMFLIFLS